MTSKMHYKHSNIKKTTPLELPCKKKTYYSQDEAKDMITYITENRTVKEMQAYKCEICGYWHLTSKLKK
jgi:hypothetical protein